MSAVHTPGPWAVSPDHIFRNQADIFEIHWSDIGECIAECVHGKENARLIAAAPDMLDALEEICSMLPYSSPTEALRIARAAITKATGEGA